MEWSNANHGSCLGHLHDNTLDLLSWIFTRTVRVFPCFTTSFPRTLCWPDHNYSRLESASLVSPHSSDP